LTWSGHAEDSGLISDELVRSCTNV